MHLRETIELGRSGVENSAIVVEFLADFSFVEQLLQDIIKFPLEGIGRILLQQRVSAGIKVLFHFLEILRVGDDNSSITFVGRYYFDVLGFFLKGFESHFLLGIHVRWLLFVVK